MVATATGAELLALRHVSKYFGGAAALEGVSLELAEGEIHALVGQNGSGKSTLIKVLTGYHAAEHGTEVHLHGVPASLGQSRVEAPDQVLPVRVVHQDAALVGGLNAVDNVALGVGYQSTRLGRVDWRRQRELTRAALRLVRAEGVRLDVPVSELEVIQRAQIAIARALVGWEDQGGLLLLDEPTSALSETEANQLFEVLGDLRAAGVTILYVSHRLDEILRIADRVTVIRDGHYIATERTGDLDYDRLVGLMVGGALELAEPHHDSTAPALDATASFEVEDLTSDAVRGLSFVARPGEIVGVTGLAGAGHEDVPLLLVGSRQARRGTLTLAGERHDLRAMSPRRAQQLGMALVPADRKVSGLVMGFAVGDNITLPRVRSFMRLGWLRRGRERSDVRTWMESLDVQPGSPDLPVSALSGGNQQKVVIAKCLGVSRGALVLSDPTAGVDVGARTAIYQRFRDEAARGLAIVVCSSDPEDLVHLCDRVVVLSKGRQTGELTGARITKEEILHACSRGAAAPTS
jgi:ABC-type sugar transport system ATPase subunit